MRGAVLMLFLSAALVPFATAARHPRRGTTNGGGKTRAANQLMHVVEPAGRGPVHAHPFVNVIVRFGYDHGTPDPATFRARIGGVNVTPLFEPLLENGTLAGLRAALGPALVSLGRRANRLRLEVRGKVGKRRVRDVDRVRFVADDVPDEAPVAHAIAGSDVILPGVPVQFDALQSLDPDSDVLTYRWDFGDGTSSTDPQPVHVFGPTTTDMLVQLTVDDGQLQGRDQVTLLACPPLCAGCTPGILKIESASALEFGGVPLGASATRTFTVRNVADTPTSDLHVRLGTNTAAFGLGTADLDLRANQSAPVDVSFAPDAPGHQSADVTLLACAANQAAVHLLTHGFGGAAPDTGPLPVADPVFYNTLTSGTRGIHPDGSRFAADNSVHLCQAPNNGPGSGDACVTDGDCTGGGTCLTTATCVRGDRAGETCTSAVDCPGGLCPAAVPLDPLKMCGDGEGGLYVMSDEGTYTDPDPNAGDDALSGTVLHVTFDPSGNRTGANIVYRTTANTAQLACDGVPAAAGGQIYIAEYRAVSGNCFRTSREALVALRKSNGAKTVLNPRIDAAEGLDACNDDYDPTDDLEVSRDGSTVFVALPNGVFRIRPTTLLMTPDIDDVFQVHPDGSVLIITTADRGPTGLLQLYKIPPEQAATGAPHLRDLTPCTTIAIPNNAAPGSTSRFTTFVSYAVDPVAPGSADATVLVSFFAGGGSGVLPRNLLVQGTYAISSPAGSNTCTPIGLVNLEPLDQMVF